MAITYNRKPPSHKSVASSFLMTSAYNYIQARDFVAEVKVKVKVKVKVIGVFDAIPYRRPSLRGR